MSKIYYSIEDLGILFYIPKKERKIIDTLQLYKNLNDKWKDKLFKSNWYIENRFYIQFRNNPLYKDFTILADIPSTVSRLADIFE